MFDRCNVVANPYLTDKKCIYSLKSDNPFLEVVVRNVIVFFLSCIITKVVTVVKKSIEIMCNHVK